MSRFWQFLDRLITRYLRQVVDVSEPEVGPRRPARLSFVGFEFRVLTPAVQRHIDQSA